MHETHLNRECRPCEDVLKQPGRRALMDTKPQEIVVAQLEAEQAGKTEAPKTGELGFSKSSWGSAC